VEVTASGKSIGNRVLKVGNDTVVYITIASWSHLFENKGKQHTSSVNVSIFDSAFLFPSLGYVKTVRIYLPPNYKSGKKKYPVLYMHDGQNVFDEFTSGYGEWHVDEALDSLYKASGKSLIVVAIDHGNEKRINEYNPYDSTRFGKGVGELYLKDIAEVLKPAIDKVFRTSASSSNTWIAGSSMGGLVSTYGVLIYPKVFGGAGIFSPAYWVNKSVEQAANKYAEKRKKSNKFYFYAGGNESKEMIPDMENIAAVVCVNKSKNCSTLVDAEAKHNEAAWTIHFHDFLKFMMANQAIR
jgi:predicted alpha/beta superfamily hydrolase